MYKSQKLFFIVACLFLLTGVQLGALGAHAFDDVLTARQINNWQLAVQYQLVHGLGLLLVGVLIDKFPTASIFRIAGGLMLIGVVLFSGSIYFSSFQGKGLISAMAPYGGGSFMLAWLLIAVGIWRN